MSRFTYDLHVHSCLSPCAEDDMTPATLAGMGKLNGLAIMALTDHNTARNCPAFFKACEHYGICPVAGMELTTAEDIHMLCLFPSLDEALAFDAFLDSKRFYYDNRPDIFGNQNIMDEDDRVIGQVPYLLSNATKLTVEDAIAEIRRRGAFICPAHIDREANSMLSVLGTIPEEYEFSCVEFRDPSKEAQIRERYGIRAPNSLYDSDSHSLYTLTEDVATLPLDVAVPTAEEVIRSLLS